MTSSKKNNWGSRWLKGEFEKPSPKKNKTLGEFGAYKEIDYSKGDKEKLKNG